MKFFNDWMPERKADQMVPWTWRKYLDEKFPEFQCWFPMVKVSGLLVVNSERSPLNFSLKGLSKSYGYR